MKTFEEFLQNYYSNITDKNSNVNEVVNISDNVEPMDNNDNNDNLENASKYFFSNIILFTDEEDLSNSKIADNIKSAISGKNINLYTFISNDTDYTLAGNHINIFDSKTKLKIDEQSNMDTIVIVRSSTYNYIRCVECIKELQDWGLFVINPIQKNSNNFNKYSLATLLERNKIPHPNFVLITKKDVDKGYSSLENKLKKIYPKLAENGDTNYKKEYIIKLLNTNSDTGMFAVNGDILLPVLRAMFAANNNLELLLQRKENPNGGDICVEVLNMRTKQIILSQIQKVAIDENIPIDISLNGAATPVELTKEQEELALKTAKLSGLTWCSVTIMHLAKNADNEESDIVIDYDSSPNVNVISKALGQNFMKILFDNINDFNELVLYPKSIGYIEDISLVFDKNEEPLTMSAKLDTGNGAYASTIGCDRLEVLDEKVIATINDKEYTFNNNNASPRIGQISESRITVIIPEIQIGTRRLQDVEFVLVDNRKKTTKILLNRDVLSKLGYIVDPSKKNILSNKI